MVLISVDNQLSTYPTASLSWINGNIISLHSLQQSSIGLQTVRVYKRIIKGEERICLIPNKDWGMKASL